MSNTDTVAVLTGLIEQLNVPRTGSHNPRFSDEFRAGFQSGVGMSIEMVIYALANIVGEDAAHEIAKKAENSLDAR